jgi:hypothetical protein
MKTAIKMGVGIHSMTLCQHFHIKSYWMWYQWKGNGSLYILISTFTTYMQVWRHSMSLWRHNYIKLYELSLNCWWENVNHIYFQFNARYNVINVAYTIHLWNPVLFATCHSLLWENSWAQYSPVSLIMTHILMGVGIHSILLGLHCYIKPCQMWYQWIGNGSLYMLVLTLTTYMLVWRHNISLWRHN